MILLVVLADVGARWLAPRLPFSLERTLAEHMEGKATELPPEERAANAALQDLADRLRAPLGMPDDITVQVRVDDSEVLNAYATVGGRIVIHPWAVAPPAGRARTRCPAGPRDGPRSAPARGGQPWAGAWPLASC